jgi:hypothetical protein
VSRFSYVNEKFGEYPLPASIIFWGSMWRELMRVVIIQQQGIPARVVRRVNQNAYSKILQP